MMLAELQRLASHLVWLATHAIDIGAITPFFYTFRERDAILDLFEEYCGARLTLNTMKIGGVPFDLPAGWVERCSALVDAFPSHIDEYEDLLTNNRIWKKRTIGIGVVAPEDAIDWGLTGPPLRGSGVRWDIRKVFPYDRYERDRLRDPDREERRHLRPVPGPDGRVPAEQTTTRGLKETEMKQVAAWIDRALQNVGKPDALAGIRGEVRELCQQFPLYAHRLG